MDNKYVSLKLVNDLVYLYKLREIYPDHTISYQRITNDIEELTERLRNSTVTVLGTRN